MRPCQRCGHTDHHRMFALMTLWYGGFAGVALHGGYFYLCPSCYETCIAPHLATGHGDADDVADPADDSGTTGAHDNGPSATAPPPRPDPTEPGSAA